MDYGGDCGGDDGGTTRVEVVSFEGGGDDMDRPIKNIMTKTKKRKAMTKKENNTTKTKAKEYADKDKDEDKDENPSEDQGFFFFLPCVDGCVVGDNAWCHPCLTF